MVLNTALFNDGLSQLCKLKKLSSVENIALFYTNEGKLFAEIPSQTHCSIRVIMGILPEGQQESVEFSADVVKILSIMKGIGKCETFELEVRPNNINIISKDKVNLSIFGGKGSLSHLPKFEDTQELGMFVIDANMWKIVSSYIECVHPLNEIFGYVHFSDFIRSTDSKLLRKSNQKISPPFDFVINKLAYSVLIDMMKENKGSVIANFFPNRVELNSQTVTLILMNNPVVLSAYKDNVVSFEMTTSATTSFSFVKAEILDFYSSYSVIMRKGNFHCTFDFVNSTLTYDHGGDSVTRNITLEKTGEFTFKKVNLERLLSCIDNCGDIVSCSSEVDPFAFLYLNNDVESVVLTVVED